MSTAAPYLAIITKKNKIFPSQWKNHVRNASWTEERIFCNLLVGNWSLENDEITDIPSRLHFVLTKLRHFPTLHVEKQTWCHCLILWMLEAVGCPPVNHFTLNCTHLSPFFMLLWRTSEVFFKDSSAFTYAEDFIWEQAFISIKIGKFIVTMINFCLSFIIASSFHAFHF